MVFFVKIVLIIGLLCTSIATTSFNRDIYVGDYIGKLIQPKIYINNNLVEFMAIQIEGYTYVRLNDLAEILNDTDKQFNIIWDKELSANNLILGEEYNSDGEGFVLLNYDEIGTQIKYMEFDKEIYVDGGLVELEGCIAMRDTYFKIRELADLLEFEVVYDSELDAIEIIV